MARLGYHLVYLEARKLSALTRFSTLCHLDLYLLGIHQILCCDAEAAAGHLFGLR